MEFEFKDLAGGLSKIIVSDNGHGLPRSDVHTLFGSLGGSWKRLAGRTKTKQRILHGQEGKGRYKAFALGKSIEWTTSYFDGTCQKSYSILLLESDLTHVTLSLEVEEQRLPQGTIVEISDLRRNFTSLTSEHGLQELAATFALCLFDYRDISIFVSGNIIDPDKAVISRTTYDLTPIYDPETKEHNVCLEIIEWRNSTKRALYLCDANGFPFSQVDTRFHIGDFYFASYLKSTYITQLHNEERLGIAEMEPKLQEAAEEARAKVKEYFRDRAAERARSVVEDWKAEDVYPFEGEPTTPIERAERQVFDIVAVTAQDYTPDFMQAPQKAKALHLRMLRHAIERSPSELQRILNEVLQLPQRKQEELAKLLEETTLSAIITAAKTIADRLKFIVGLESIVFSEETKHRLKERSQLHKIVAENTWIFGEKYNLWVGDRSLTQVLKKHKEYLDSNIIIDDPVRIVGKSRGIVDLMLSCATRRHRADDIEHLVVELKAPSVTIGTKQISQTKEYAFAVAADERFHSVSGVRWHFWVISNSYNDFARLEIEGGPDQNRRLVHRRNFITVGIKTWAEVISENKARLQFLQEHLQFKANENEALNYLQKRHKQFLEGVFDHDSDQPAPDNENISDQKATA